MGYLDKVLGSIQALLVPDDSLYQFLLAKKILSSKMWHVSSGMNGAIWCYACSKKSLIKNSFALLTVEKI